jgi:uncharacterized protein (TIGR02217 family)
MTQPFLETPRFPDDLGFWALGGVNYSTIVVGSTSGRESRNSLWQYARGQWDLQNTYRANATVGSPYALQTLRNFFRVCKGQAYGFRFRDWADFQDEGNGIMGLPLTSFSSPLVPTGTGGGVPVYQLFKSYIAAPLADYRVIQKPYPTGVVLKRNGTVIASGTSPGNAVLDTTTGLVTFVADSSATITGASAAAACVLTCSAIPAGAAAGKFIYVSGVSNSVGTFLNGQAWEIDTISGDAITLFTATTGLVAGTGGIAAMYAQGTEALTWTGLFDTPARFGTDAFEPAFDSDGLYTFQTLKIVEIRL